MHAETVSYTRGLDLSGSLEGAGGIGGLLARSSGYSSGNWTSHAYYHEDGNGNVTCLIGSSQSVVASYRYDPFGNTITKSGSLADANVYRFSSKECLTNSLMYYYGYRFYDPNLQRWINRDPIHEEGSINLYEFVENDPNGRVDWLGLKGAEDLCHRATPDEVANNAGKSCNYKSRRENREYCGNVCRNNRTGRLSKTQTAGTIDGCNPGSAPCPGGTTLVSVWHTHGGNDPRYDNENFSDADRRYADRLHVPIFVRTPGCHTKKYTPGQGEVILE